MLPLVPRCLGARLVRPLRWVLALRTPVWPGAAALRCVRSCSGAGGCGGAGAARGASGSGLRVPVSGSHPAAVPAAQTPADGPPEGITGRVRHRRCGDEPPHPGVHPRRAGSRHWRDEKPAGSASRADCFPGIRFHCDRCCRPVRPLACRTATPDSGPARGEGYDASATKLACYRGHASTWACVMRLAPTRGCSCSASTCCTAETGEVVTADVLFVDWLSAGVRGATHCDLHVAEA